MTPPVKGCEGFREGLREGLEAVVDDLVKGVKGYKEKFLNQEECGLKSEKDEQGSAVVQKVSAQTLHTLHNTVRHALQPFTRPFTTLHATLHQVTA